MEMLNGAYLKAYEMGKNAAKDHECIRQAYETMRPEDLDFLISNNDYDEFFTAGFNGREPEWVEAIRYGEIPARGYSVNHADGTREHGVSVVKIIRREGDEDYKSIYDVTLGWQGIEKIRVSGWYLGGSGSDGEPLLVGAKKI